MFEFLLTNNEKYLNFLTDFIFEVACPNNL